MHWLVSINKFAIIFRYATQFQTYYIAVYEEVYCLCSAGYCIVAGQLLQVLNMKVLCRKVNLDYLQVPHIISEI